MTSLLSGMGQTISKKPEPIITAVVTVTERAAAKAKTILESKGHPDGMLRVFVVGGGCSGYQYGMSIAPAAEAEDQVIETDAGVRVVIDRESAPMISGAEIDYHEDL
ncbi:MAG: iron-sulfur cluster assembly accessory protein, partial [Chloroflexi bacterium]|nr:iron-sulfur cluster assembly accessory protein [Chloroflexota bacterium]